MKKIVITLLSAITTLISIAQKSPIVKLHVYSREVLGGAQQKKQSVSESGVVTDIPLKKPLQYFIYAETKHMEKPAIKNVWIGSQKYEVLVNENIIKSPVIFSNTTVPGLQNDTLIKATINKIWMVTLKEPLAKINNSTAVSKLLAGNEALISYQQGKTVKYLGSKKIKKLQPMVVL
ncbi:MAG: hypothetical protein EAZ16_05550 [Sphingobacteriales bacterium]|nr:MAG: hypothetical protein EAZ16_05550 [Sphingobacteriales bacterium]